MVYGRAEIRNRGRVYRRCAATARNSNETGFDRLSRDGAAAGSYAGWPNPPARPYSRDSVSRDFFQPSAERIVGGEPPDHTIHLPVKAANIKAAEDMGASLADSLAHLDAFLGHDVTVSEGDGPPRRVFCPLLLADETPCARRWQHEGVCGPDPDTP